MPGSFSKVLVDNPYSARVPVDSVSAVIRVVPVPAGRPCPVARVDGSFRLIP